MKIGLLREGKNDDLPIRELLKKIFACELCFNSIPTDGQIVNKIRANLEIFFGRDDDRCDMVFLISDVDKYPKREKEVREILNKNKYFQRGEKIVCGFPSPNFEQWLISEEDAIKAVFKLPSTLPLPYREIKDPKNRLQKIIDESDLSLDVTVTNEEIYARIVIEMNIETLQLRNQSFRKFLTDIEYVHKPKA